MQVKGSYKLGEELKKKPVKKAVKKTPATPKPKGEKKEKPKKPKTPKAKSEKKPKTPKVLAADTVHTQTQSLFLIDFDFRAGQYVRVSRLEIHSCLYLKV